MEHRRAAVGSHIRQFPRPHHKSTARVTTAAGWVACLFLMQSCSNCPLVDPAEPRPNPPKPNAPKEETRANLPDLPDHQERTAFVEAALRTLPISWQDLVVPGEYYRHNPDEWENVLGLFAPGNDDYLARQERTKNEITQKDLPWAKVVTPLQFARMGDVPRVIFVYSPLLSRQKKQGLLVVQLHEDVGKNTFVKDDWVLMELDKTGTWQRKKMPAELRKRLHLPEE